jgi:hypothetical protein
VIVLESLFSLFGAIALVYFALSEQNTFYYRSDNERVRQKGRFAEKLNEQENDTAIA